MEIPTETKNLIQKRIGEIREQYPEAQAACLPALHVAQDHLNHVSDDVLNLVAETLSLPTAFVQGVATFYTMYNQREVGKYHLQLCTNVSCMLEGAEELLMGLEEHLGIKSGETTKDGLFTLTAVECLAACGMGPVLQVNDMYHESMTLEKTKELLEKLKSGKDSQRVEMPVRPATPAAKPAAPAAKPAAPAAKPVAKPVAKPMAKPAAKPAAPAATMAGMPGLKLPPKPAAKPGAVPALKLGKPAAKPAAKPVEKPGDDKDTPASDKDE